MKMAVFSTWRVFVMVAIFGALLSGCAVDRPKPASEVAFSPGYGVAVLEVTANGRASAVFLKWEQLLIRNAATGEQHLAFDDLHWESHRSLFVIDLPEGEYYLEALQNFQSSQIGIVPIPGTNTAVPLISSSAGYARLGEEVGRFSVHSEKVTNLGMMAFTRVNTGDDHGYRIDFLPAKSEFNKVLRILDPGVSAAARSGVVGWAVGRKGESGPYKPGKAYGVSYYLNGPSRAKDGSLYFGEAFGQIARRDPAGNWNWLKTGGVSPILAVTALDNGAILAGSEEGGIFFRKAGDEQWRIVPFPLANTFIRFVDHLPGVGYVAVAHDKENAFVMQASDLEKPTWSELARMPLNLARTWLSPDALPVKVWRNRGHLVVATSAPFEGLSRQMYFYDFDSSSRTWRTISVKQGFNALGAFSVSPDGTLFGLTAALGFQSGSISADGGDTWEKRTSPNWLIASAFRNAKEGFAVRQDSMIGGERSIWATTDGGNAWAKLNSAPDYATRLILLDSPKDMMVVTQDNQLFLTKDAGANWTLERSGEEL